jgi:hypothetical protein
MINKFNILGTHGGDYKEVNGISRSAYATTFNNNKTK